MSINNDLDNLSEESFSKPEYKDSAQSAESATLINSLRSLRVQTEESVVRNRMIGVLETSCSAYRLLSLSVEELRSLIDFDHASVALCDVDGEHLHIYEIAKAITEETVSCCSLAGSLTEQALKCMGATLLADLTISDAPSDHTNYPFRSGVICPLYSNGQPIGSLALWSLTFDAYTEDDLALLERMTPAFGDAIESTIRNRKKEDSVEILAAELKRFQVINDLCVTLQKAHDHQQAIDASVEFIGNTLRVDRCRALLFSDKVYAEYVGEWMAPGVPPVSDAKELHKRNPIPELIRTDGKPIVMSDVASERIGKGLEDLIAKNQLKSIIYVPIVHHDAVIGTLTVHQTRYQRNWAKEEVVLLVAVATQLGAAMENIRLIARLREANRLKDEFLTNLSHELRTPLNGISGYLELLSFHPAVESDQELAEGFSTINSSAKVLTRLISDLLDMSRIQQNKLTLKRVKTDINLTIKNAAYSLEQSLLAQSLNLQFELSEELPMLYLDNRCIEKVIWNLLSNAIKFTPVGGKIYIRSFLGEVPSGLKASNVDLITKWIVIEVEDGGDGISPDFIPFIWQRFRQADGSSTRKHGGLGIGLSLVRDFIEAHGGHVEAKNGPNKGAIFRIWLPIF